MKSTTDQYSTHILSAWFLYWIPETQRINKTLGAALSTCYEEIWGVNVTVPLPLGWGLYEVFLKGDKIL